MFPDGASSLVVRGMMNLAQRAMNTAATPVVPGEPMDYREAVEKALAERKAAGRK